MASSRLIFVLLLAAFGFACGVSPKATSTTSTAHSLYNPGYYPNYNSGWVYPWGLGYTGSYYPYNYGYFPNTVPHHPLQYPYYYNYPHVSTSQVTHHGPVVSHGPQVTTNTYSNHLPYAFPYGYRSYLY